MKKYQLQGLLYDAHVRAARDCQVPSDICRVAVTQEANGFAVWCGFTEIQDTPEDRSYDYHFSALYETREEAIERAVQRVGQARIQT